MRLFILSFFAVILALSAAIAEPKERSSPLRRWVSGFSHRIWAGPIVDAPVIFPRPAAPHLASSADDRFHLHGEAHRIRDRMAVLGALDHAHEVLLRLGFSPPIPDGGRGGTQGFDLYFVDEPIGAEARSDGLDPLASLDAAMAYGVVGNDVPPRLIPACVVDAYAQAALLGLDPAESPRIRRALSAFITYQTLGIAGCEDAIDAWQFAPEEGPFSESLHEGAGGVLFLLVLDARWGGEGRIPAEVLSLARQLTWDGSSLRASPDFWEALEAIAQAKQDRFADLLVGLAIDRLFTGEYAARPELRSIPAPHAFRRGRPRTYSFHTGASPRGVAPGGAIHAEFRLEGLEEGDALNCWVDGEFGFQFTLAALAFDEENRELRRFVSPPGGSNHRAFVPFIVPEGAHRIRLIGISLGFERPDEDLPPPVARRARFILERPEQARAEP